MFASTSPGSVVLARSTCGGHKGGMRFRPSCAFYFVGVLEVLGEA